MKSAVVAEGGAVGVAVGIADRNNRGVEHLRGIDEVNVGDDLLGKLL